MLQNCIGLSRHCVLLHRESVEWQLSWNQDYNQEFYETKLNYVVKSIPDKMMNWCGYEFDHYDIYKVGYRDFRKKKPVDELTQQIAERGLWSTITTHNYGWVRDNKITEYWPTIKYVDLVNNTKFATTWLPRKGHETPFDTQWSTRGTTPVEHFNFDVDNTFYNQRAFLKQVRQLYNWLGFDDFKARCINEYYRKYIGIHK